MVSRADRQGRKSLDPAGWDSLFLNTLISAEIVCFSLSGCGNLLAVLYRAADIDGLYSNLFSAEISSLCAGGSRLPPAPCNAPQKMEAEADKLGKIDGARR